jgi:hypothetical protein
VTLGFVLLHPVAQLVALIAKFGNAPNYWTGYNWPKNLWVIYTSTPSLSDSISIAADEWLLEVGYMNYDFGLGIAEWALSVMPAKMSLILALGMLAATVCVLCLHRRENGVPAPWIGCGLAAVGAALVAFTSATMHWVASCAEPSWIVGLTMMGLSVPLALRLEPAGPWLSAVGFGLLALAVLASTAPDERSTTPVKTLAGGNAYGS